MDSAILFVTFAAMMLWVIFCAVWDNRLFRNHLPRKWGSYLGGWVLIFVLGMGCDDVMRILAQARENPRGISCLSNVKQLGLGMFMYVQDWDERLPAAAQWGHSVYPYLKNERLYKCPQAKSPYGYAFNRYLNLLPLEKFKEPAATVLLFEADASTMDTFGHTSLMVPKPRHAGGDNISFSDGHAKWIRRGNTLQWRP